MTREPTLDATTLTARIRRMRDTGRVACQAGPVASDDPDAVFLALTGMVPDPGAWHPVDRDTAERIAARVLQRDLAYDGPVLPERTARQLARELMALAPPGAAFYTNAPELAEGAESWSWTPITGEEGIEVAVLVVAPELSVALWVLDDD